MCVCVCVCVVFQNTTHTMALTVTFDDMPPELLCMIFRACFRNEEEGWLSFSIFLSVKNVCHRWMQVFNEHNGLWRKLESFELNFGKKRGPAGEAIPLALFTRAPFVHFSMMNDRVASDSLLVKAWQRCNKRMRRLSFSTRLPCFFNRVVASLPCTATLFPMITQLNFHNITFGDGQLAKFVKLCGPTLLELNMPSVSFANRRELDCLSMAPNLKMILIDGMWSKETTGTWRSTSAGPIDLGVLLTLENLESVYISSCSPITPRPSKLRKALRCKDAQLKIEVINISKVRWNCM